MRLKSWEEQEATGGFLIKHVAEDGLIRFVFLKCQQKETERPSERLLRSSRWDMMAVVMKQERWKEVDGCKILKK